ncbi:hypothetical protein QBC41DRAFT_347158 [Cercophora samala]|uniref:Uncharacterized protein n=1 Tax=Cercophora samala TaxID=330535 RepID=A0AA39ZDE4_9PEZI|nr:hypothetical protein QBC41DRAFT_347158 [Cercophora samala]
MLGGCRCQNGWATLHMTLSCPVTKRLFLIDLFVLCCICSTSRAVLGSRSSRQTQQGRPRHLRERKSSSGIPTIPRVIFSVVFIENFCDTKVFDLCHVRTSGSRRLLGQRGAQAEFWQCREGVYLPRADSRAHLPATACIPSSQEFAYIKLGSIRNCGDPVDYAVKDS